MFFLTTIFIYSCRDVVDRDATKGTILDFTLKGFETNLARIDQNSNLVSITLPYQTNLKLLKPEIVIPQGFEIIPASGIEQDFSSAVYYTLISPSGVKVIYTVRISTDSQPQPVITGISSDSVEAGFDFKVSGHFFGNFPLDVKASAENENYSQSLTVVSHSDSSLRIRTNEMIPPGAYLIKIKVKNLEVLTNKTLKVTYPAPQVLSFSHANFFPPDTLKIVSKFLNLEKFRYAIRLSEGSDSLTYSKVNIKNDTLKYGIAKDFKPGRYLMRIVNLSDGKTSRENAISFNVYSGNLPFAKISVAKPYLKGENLVFSTFNFNSNLYRFYQVTFTGQGKLYIQNGIYNEEGKKLIVSLPEDIVSGSYALAFSLSDPSKGVKYDFKTDDTLIIK